MRRLTVDAYLSGEETMRRQELTYGVVREPPAPGYGHQIALGRLFRRLEQHVRRSRAGVVVLSPIDVVLDKERALILQPDLVFVSAARVSICSTRIWGAPDLVLEVLSIGNRRYDAIVKVAWYREYGVRECWLVDPPARRIEVIDLTVPDGSVVYEGDARLHSRVLPRLRLRPAQVNQD